MVTSISNSKKYKVGAQITDLSVLGDLALSKRSVVIKHQNPYYYIKPAAFMVNWPLRELLKLKLYYPAEMTKAEQDYVASIKKINRMSLAQKIAAIEKLENERGTDYSKPPFVNLGNGVIIELPPLTIPEDKEAFIYNDMTKDLLVRLKEKFGK